MISLDVYEDESETTIPRRRKRRDSHRRVSFAETETVHVFQRDDEYATPPGSGSEVSQRRRRSPRLAAKRRSSGAPDIQIEDPDTASSTEKTAIGFGLGTGEEAAAPVDIGHIVQADQSSPSLEDDITLDSKTFSAKFFKLGNDGDGEVDNAGEGFDFPSVGVRSLDKTAAPQPQKESLDRPSSWNSDMSLTVQRPRRPLPVAEPSPMASFDRMLYTKVVDAATLEQQRQKRRQVYTGLKKRLRLDNLAEKPKPNSPHQRPPLQEINIVRQSHVKEGGPQTPTAKDIEAAESIKADGKVTVAAESKDGKEHARMEEADSAEKENLNTPVQRTPIQHFSTVRDSDLTSQQLRFVHVNCAQASGSKESEKREEQWRNSTNKKYSSTPPQRPILHELSIVRQSEMKDGGAERPIQQLQVSCTTAKSTEISETCNFEEQRKCIQEQEQNISGALQTCFEDVKALDDRLLRIEQKLHDMKKKKKKSEEELLKEVTSLRRESQERQERNKLLKATYEALEAKIRNLSSVSEVYKFEQSKYQLLQKIQGWHITKMKCKEDTYRLEMTYGHRVNQSIIIEGKPPARCVWITILPDLKIINSGFPHMNSVILFQSLLPAERFKIDRLKSLRPIMQQTSDLVTTLLQVAQEANSCRVKYRCMKSVVFLNSKERGICLQFSFESLQMRLSLKLLFSLQVLNCGAYPKDINPCEITVEPRSPSHKVVITEDDLRRAICSLPAGFRRFRRICTCVSSFFPI